MPATSDEVYKQINNALYNEQGNTWWDENQCLHLLKSSVNPVRVGYFRRLLDQVLEFDYHGATALDVGCGGGILAEEFAGMGFRLTGIDPSEQSLHTARQHAQSMGLSIQYQEGTGESIPFADNTYRLCTVATCWSTSATCPK
jgi:2-polyprenyl-6-hydroxyphenyl methylase/3-demethylubiquinone-9 3-methyltransferase